MHASLRVRSPHLNSSGIARRYLSLRVSRNFAAQGGAYRVQFFGQEKFLCLVAHFSLAQNALHLLKLLEHTVAIRLS